MFCSKCGTENKDGVSFCKNCGATMGSDSKQRVEVYSEPVEEKKKSGDGKKVIAGGGVLAVLIVAVVLMTGGGYNSNERCEWCGNTPTKSFEGFYYCEDCAETCWFCYEEATKYYMNGLDELTFVCDDCYEEEMEE